MSLLRYPRYVRVKNRLGQPEWVVRGIERTTINEHGDIVPQPDSLLNRYYRHDTHIRLADSVIQLAGGKGFLTFDELPIDAESIEYDNPSHFLRYADLQPAERDAAKDRHVISD